ncbi:unnamed protein product [Pseudo-nitzschia multistriata]|uniref:Uncharacterized protein n=1 Tax=Pseudo-nitzschia multistriata TaxID=183589 RepID=A0A448ZC96_9STRA|nr:unnamed protein product [Pseudo-nitzschia multistriata]
MQDSSDKNRQSWHRHREPYSGTLGLSGMDEDYVSIAKAGEDKKDDHVSAMKDTKEKGLEYAWMAGDGGKEEVDSVAINISDIATSFLEDPGEKQMITNLFVSQGFEGKDIIGKEKKDSVVSGMEDKKEREVDDISRRVLTREVEAVEEKQEYLGVNDGNLFSKIGKGMQMENEKQVDRSGKWHVLSDSKDNHDNKRDDSVSNGSKQDSDDEFSFDSDGEGGEEEKSNIQKASPSIVKAFDMDLLRYCISKGEESVLNIDGRDVIVIVGKTGTGKSTLIQGIAGKHFKKLSFSSGGAVSKSIFEAEDPVSGFEIGHAKVSMTKYIKCFFRKGGTEDEAVYLDTPGFEDTDGEEVDIATSVMLAQVAKKSRSMRFVMMINYVSLLEDRGGAIRSVLKLMRNFVTDFKKERTSFMFLFSHADEIKDVPDSIIGAKKSLLEEIIRTISGTKDDGVRDLLTFIRKSLEKGYPFVDVLHPLKTDYSLLVNFMECKLKPTKRMIVGNGGFGLTLSSQMKLTGAAQKLLRALRILLNRGDVDIKEVQEIRSSFEYFKKYIDFEDMRAAVKDCDEILCDHVAYLRSVVDREVEAGTSSEVSFTEVNIAYLQDALSQLVAIDSSFNMDIQSNIIVSEVTKFQKGLFTNLARRNFDGFHQDLTKLKEWCGFSSDFRVLVDPLIDHATMIAKKAKDEVSNFAVTNIFSSSEATLSNLFSELKVLESIHRNERGLSVHLGIVSQALDSLKSFSIVLQSHLRDWNAELAQAGGKQIDFRNERSMEVIATQIANLERVANLSKVSQLENEIFHSIEFVRKTIHSQIMGKCSTICSGLKNTDYGRNEEWLDGLSMFRNAVTSFSTLESPSVRQMESSYAAIRDEMKSHLKTKYGELDEMSQNAATHGLIDGAREGDAVCNFKRYLWFDDFLPIEECFVQNCFTKLMSDYFRVVTTDFETLEALLYWLANCHGDSVDATHELRQVFSTILEWGIFGRKVENEELTTGVAGLVEKMNYYVSKRIYSWEEVLTKWTGVISFESIVWEQVTVATESLNAVLGEISEIIEIECREDIKEDVKSMKEQIITAMDIFKENTELTLDDSLISYDEIATSLARVQALGDFPLTSPHLPRFDTIQEYAQKRVANEARKIADMVEQTSEFDKIDLLLLQFEKAQILDNFVHQEVSNHLRPLKRLRTEREIDVNDLIMAQIEREDFAGLNSLLRPLSKTKDLIQKEKFKNYVSKIDERILETHKKLSSIFCGTLTDDKAQKIIACVKVLEQANEEVGEYLPKGTRINKKTTSWKRKVNGKVENMIRRMRFAIKRVDFMELARTREKITIASNHFSPYLIHEVETGMKEVDMKYSELTLSVPLHINKFIEGWFSESKEIQKILDGLKSTTNLKDDPIFTDLSQLYNDNAKLLLEQVNELVQTTKDSVTEAQCYDDSIAVLQNLKRSLDSGLERHLPQEIGDDCDQTIARYEKARKRELRVDFEVVSAEAKFKKLAMQMDKLDPESTGFFTILHKFSGRKTYDNLKREISGKVQHHYRKGIEALQRRDYNTLNDSLNQMAIMNKTIVKHVPLVSSKLQELNEKTLTAFQSICKNSQEALQSDNCRAFEPLFADYSGFVISVTTLMKDDRATKTFSLTNQLVYERMVKEVSSVEDELSTFEFNVMKQKIEEVRAFGGFIADRFSIFHEQLKGVFHVKSDRWLGLLRGMITTHFQNGRDLRRLKFYAILGLPPSASKKEIRQAHEEQVKILVDSPKNTDSISKLDQMKEAISMLENEGVVEYNSSSKPFDEQVRGIGNRLRETTREALKEQHYDLIEKLLFKLQGIDAIGDLVSPKLDTCRVKESVVELVKNHVDRIRVEVMSNWSQRMYQDLNHNISDLKLMEERFKSHKHIFSSSWNTGIVDSVEKEIEKLGKHATSLLKTRSTANESRDEFRRCFMRMGAVLVELPQFKDHTKDVMSDVLGSCLNSDWGYGFVFDLGLSLQKGEDTNDDDEVRIAQNLVTEFGHFKEVLTMVWNEETIQKPPEATVKDIRGENLEKEKMTAIPLDIKSDQLLQQFFDFETKYTSLLGEFLVPGADLNALVRTIVDAAEEMKPLSCDDGFGPETKRVLPELIAGVFSLFTILKSGDSYNRLQDAPNGQSVDSSKLLMKPHNIQILTLLCMFGCGTSDSSSLRSQLMQIRTGEGKSMILGAAATIFGLLGFQVRCICYSEYLSSRDFELFRDVFRHFDLLESIKYSKITTLSEETTAAKGNIREMTLSLINGNQCVDQKPMSKTTKISNSREADGKDSNTSSKTMKKSFVEEIMLVDEVDVFFGSEFYGRTYNQVAELREPEVATILRTIWEGHKRGGRKLRLADIKALVEYTHLRHKLAGYEFLIDNEISLMLDQVRRVDDEPMYHLDRVSDRIGYKIQDTISYNVTYGYRTIFAYLKEADNGNLNNPAGTLARVLTMPISCGQFSYANIKPTRILGVSGTLEVMSNHQKIVLQKYGVSQYLYVPSVYGQSNFSFDKGGEGVSIEKSTSDFFQKITDETARVATKQRRAVIVFFNDSKRLNEYVKSAFYRKLGRKKEILTESKNANEKAFIISKAATAGQITICTAVFGRGTDFFSKDDALDNNGGVHVIQAFLSCDMSEEVQIQGRTARQGKKGSYKLILLDKDLEDKFGIKCGSFGTWPRGQFYDRLCEARNKALESDYLTIEMSLSKAKTKDDATHQYFDALLNSNVCKAKSLLKEIYLSMKKKHTGPMSIDLAIAIDITGSMAPYAIAIASTIQNLLAGQNPILAKLTSKFPDSKFKLRVAVLGFRDIDDGSRQFEEKLWDGVTHFGENVEDTIRYVKSLTSSTSGGSDLAEDHLGAIDRCVKWNSSDDWKGMIKAILLLTDAPAHGYAPNGDATQNIDNYSVRHPLGLTMDSVVENVLDKDIDLFVCSFDPIATQKFEEKMSEAFNRHPSNVDGREVTMVQLVPKTAVHNKASRMMGDSRKHNIFVLDESGSMSNDWSGVVQVYNKYLENRRQRQHDSDLISVVQFSGTARVTCSLAKVASAPRNLGYNGGGTCFSPAAICACDLARKTPQSHQPVVIFMSDGMAEDSHIASSHFLSLNEELKTRSGLDLELHVIGFGGGTDTSQLQEIARASANGRVHTTSDIDSLSRVFVQISGGGDNVSSVLEAEISKRISDAVTNRLSVEYFG